MSIVVDSMATYDMGQLNPIANQYGVFLNLVFFNFPEILHVAQVGDPILRLDQHHPAFDLTCDVKNFEVHFHE
jgi:hypothetical protein